MHKKGTQRTNYNSTNTNHLYALLAMCIKGYPHEISLKKQNLIFKNKKKN